MAHKKIKKQRTISSYNGVQTFCSIKEIMKM